MKNLFLNDINSLNVFSRLLSFFNDIPESQFNVLNRILDSIFEYHIKKDNKINEDLKCNTLENAIRYVSLVVS